MGALRRLAIPLVLAVWLAVQLWQYGFTVRTVLGFCAPLLILLFGEAFAERVPQPLRNYAILAAISAFAGLFLFSLTLSPIAVIFWLTCTAMALFWVWYWERTERLPSED